EIASGRLRLQAFAVTEPNTGSDTTQLRTRAVRSGDHYVANGQKVWTSRALHSDLMLLLARTTPLDQVARRTDGLSVFLVDLREARGKGFRYILDGMNAERILVASECIGDGRWLLRQGVSYASDREVFGRPIGQNQGVQFPLARAFADLEAADLMCRKAAALFDAGLPCGADANIAKMLASEATWKAADTTLQTFGGFGYAQEYDIERKWREVRLYQTAPISTNMVLAYVAQHVLGLPRSY
ncbi:MAG: acyl-CoA dehydrogenase, partial [Mesorhizobium sp.]